jgi:hypothetical protein
LPKIRSIEQKSAMATVGYEFLRDHLGLSAFPVRRPAQVTPVKRIFAVSDTLQVPKEVAPQSDDLLDHILFALKHEGTNLQVLAEALPQVAPKALITRLRESPTGGFIRKACYLWESFTGMVLQDLPVITGSYTNLFDPTQYITGPAQRSAKWRVNFNGLGSLDYCPSVERTTAVEEGIASDILGRTKAFLDAIGAVNADRALSWAYLSETEHSFAIERESPSPSRADAFVALLQQAHERRPLTEDYLVELQSATILNPYSQAAAFRAEQNWLRGGAVRGAGSVTYVPPAPQLLAKLMSPFMELANKGPKHVDPIVAASVSSFGFVYLHPFMDGNGRLSRFLFHYALCQSGQLEKGLLLPVSVAMKRNEDAYLVALQSFSKPARRLWDVHWIDEDTFDFKFKGRDSIYRYWDATPCVEFGFQMAEQALNVDLRQETDYLARFDRVAEIVNAQYDIRSNDLHVLLVSAFQNNGVVSKNRRKQYAERVPAAALDFLEEVTRQELAETALAIAAPEPPADPAPG